MMTDRLHYYDCINANGDKLEIYSFFCQNYYWTEQRNKFNEVISLPKRIEYHEVNNIVFNFTGKSIRHYEKEKKTKQETNEKLTVKAVDFSTKPEVQLNFRLS